MDPGPAVTRIEEPIGARSTGGCGGGYTLIEQLSPQFYRFFAAQPGNRGDASDMLQEAWLRVHRMRRTYRAGQHLLPWIYANTRCVRVDGYRKRPRIAMRGRFFALPPTHSRSAGQPVRGADHAPCEWQPRRRGCTGDFGQRRISEAKCASSVPAPFGMIPAGRVWAMPSLATRVISSHPSHGYSHPMCLTISIRYVVSRAFGSSQERLLGRMFKGTLRITGSDARLRTPAAVGWMF